MGTLHGDEPGYVLCSGWVTRLKHWLEPVQRIDGLRIEWFARLPGHVGNLHHANLSGTLTSVRLLPHHDRARRARPAAPPRRVVYVWDYFDLDIRPQTDH